MSAHTNTRSVPCTGYLIPYLQTRCQKVSDGLNSPKSKGEELTLPTQFISTLNNTNSLLRITSRIGSYLCSWTIWISTLARTSGTFYCWRETRFCLGPRWRCWHSWSRGYSFRNGRNCWTSYGELAPVPVLIVAIPEPRYPPPGRGENKAAMEVAKRERIPTDGPKYAIYGVDEDTLWDKIESMDSWWKDTTWKRLVLRELPDA